MKLWGSRMAKNTEPLVEKLNLSLPFDVRLYAEDIDASLAWAAALAHVGVLTQAERRDIVDGLQAVRRTFEGGAFEPAVTDEDIHTAVERMLTEKIGSPAGKLHTGRSRNDQVATDLRLWVMRACDRIEAAMLELAKAILDSAEVGLEFPMPGYTHLRRAQPVTWGHWVLSAFWPLMRARDRFHRARSSAAVLPLGSGALAGTAFPIDRQALAEELDFDSVSPNSIDAVSDRDFALEFLFAAAMLGVELSRFAEAMILFSSDEFGFIELDEAYTTGSSLMPQKMNPDPLELTRGKAGRLIGSLAGLLATLKGLPSAYDKDLQEDKEPLFDACDTVLLILPALTGLLRTLRLHPDRMAGAVGPELLATDLVDYLVRKRVPFRVAHDHVGRAVRLAEERDLKLDELPLNDLQKLDGNFERDVEEVFDLRAALERRSATGGTAPTAVRSQLDAAKRAITGA